MFIDRETELAALERLFASDRAELFILYGRHRVGKTELLRAFCEGKPNVFFMATLSADADQLTRCSRGRGSRLSWRRSRRRKTCY